MCLQQYGEQYDKKISQLILCHSVRHISQCVTLGGPVSRGTQAFLKSLIKEILSILSNIVCLHALPLGRRPHGPEAGVSRDPRVGVGNGW